MSLIARHSGTLLILAVLAAALVADGLIAAFVIKPPLLGWVGFAIVSAVVLGLGVLAPVAFERTRVSPVRPAETSTPQRRLLVIADPSSNASRLCDAILAHLGDADVHVVVPLRVSRLHFVTDDEDRERREARDSMLRTVTLLQQRAATATGSVGSDKPLESMTDALGSFPATQVLLAMPPEEESYWLEDGLLTKARTLTRIPVTQVVVPATGPESPPKAGSGRGGSRSA
jgi:hypothetical protein